ncbi:TetR family transcriptional regulator C-terminal domain-containing protein [Brevibacterium sp. FME17]|uniref:TetR family transcriptional regulator C-terminal domain-containing protein n=1 Tax=Brevibacterium sp. FME17 TaxID=2742606 RepID=UPI00299F88A9|nr:TetR family transcriptional regulator C-terminal domain-containing protein [Brevibacterium sp. FME17]
MVTESKGADSTQMSLVTRVRDAIKHAGINHSEIARRIGLDASKLSKSLTGTRKFRVEEISRIAELTEVSTDWITTGRTAGPPRRGRTTSTPGNVHVGSTHIDASLNGTDIPSIPGQSVSGDTSAADPTQEWMSKGTRNRVRIISAAWELYADLGIDKVRTEDVARAADMTTSAVNYHFRTKDQLLQAALRYSLDIIAETRHLNDDADPLAVLRHFARLHAGVDTKIRRVWSIWLQCWARAVTDENARANLTAVYGEWLDMITTVIDSGQRSGVIRTGDTTLMVKSLSIFIDGLGVARSTEHMPITDDEALMMLEHYLSAHIITDAEALQMLDDYLSEHIAATGRDQVLAAADSHGNQTLDRPVPHPQEEGT